MFIKFSKSEKGDNKGSVAALVNYLTKEDKGKDYSEQEHFFSHSEDRIGIGRIIQRIDGNRKKLGKNDAKFYMLTLNPTEEELAFIDNDPGQLRAYTRKVMDLYAQNFQKGLRGEDLMYFAKIEYHRNYTSKDEAVQKGLKKVGDQKSGLHTHIHVIVSRKDIYNKLRLSPLTNHKGTKKGAVKGGFDRVALKNKAEIAFDQLFGYDRKLKDSFTYQNIHSKRYLLKEEAQSVSAEILHLNPDHTLSQIAKQVEKKPQQFRTLSSCFPAITESRQIEQTSNQTAQLPTQNDPSQVAALLSKMRSLHKKEIYQAEEDSDIEKLKKQKLR